MDLWWKWRLLILVQSKPLCWEGEFLITFPGDNNSVLHVSAIDRNILWPINFLMYFFCCLRYTYPCISNLYLTIDHIYVILFKLCLVQGHSYLTNYLMAFDEEDEKNDKDITIKCILNLKQFLLLSRIGGLIYFKVCFLSDKGIFFFSQVMWCQKFWTV